MKDKLIEFLANIPMTSWNVRGVAELLIEDGWMKMEPNTKRGSKEFLDAVDVVCLDCYYLSEETCETCPVRKTVDKLADIKG